MAAILSPIASFALLPQAPRVDVGKPVTSVTSLSQLPVRQIQLPALTHPVRRATFLAPVAQLSALIALAREPEDARITGGTRSLDRRLLALNLSGVATHSRAVSIQN